jgi:PAS domain S-box-containing protein
MEPMRPPRAPTAEGLVSAARLSDAVIGPNTPPDPKDAFSLLIDEATEYAVFALSPDGLVSTWNQGAQRIKGYRAHEIIGRHFSVFYPETDREAGIPDQLLEEALRDGRVQVEGWRVRQDGSKFWASVVIAPLFDEVGRLRGFGKLTRDETERRAAEVLHEQLSRMTDQERIASALASTLVHRLFNVGLQMDSVYKLERDADQCQRIRDAAQDLDDAIKYLRRTVFDMSDSRRATPPA